VASPVLPYPPIGGGHKRTLRLCEAIERVGLQPVIVTADAGQPDAADVLRGRGWVVDVHATDRLPPGQALLERAGRLPSGRLPALSAALRERVAAGGVAFVQLETMLMARYLVDLDGVLVVLSTHNVDSDVLRTIAKTSPGATGRLKAWNRWQATRAVERWAAPRANAVLCVSEHDVRHFAAENEKVLLVPNGADDEYFAINGETPTQGDDVLFFGQLDWEPNDHGLSRFLREGWPRLVELRPHARLRIAGRGAGDALMALVDALPGVELLGLVGDLVAELAATQVVLVPLWQGGGTRLKVLEAMAAARPVVGTSLAVEEVGFVPGEHGLVADDPAGLAAAAAALLADPGHARQLGLQARGHAEAYRWARCTEPFECLVAAWGATG
jgi:glycosyltransferase involved in cell wall biosynthesis